MLACIKLCIYVTNQIGSLRKGIFTDLSFEYYFYKLSIILTLLRENAFIVNINLHI